MEVLVHFIECLGVDALGEVGMLLGPVLENQFEVGADADGFLQQFFNVFVEEELQGVGHQHEVEDEVFVLWVVVEVTHHIPHLIRVLGYQFVLDVPVSLPDHVGEENGLDLVHQEYLCDGFEHFVDRVPEGYGATPGH